MGVMDEGNTSASKVTECKHGCGLKYYHQKNQKRERDRFDYHQRSGCTLISPLICIYCSTKRKSKTYRGFSSYHKHCEGKKHQEAVEKAEGRRPSLSRLYDVMNEV